MKDENEDNLSRSFLKQRIKNVKNILIKENEMPKIDQIFKYELKTNYTEIDDLLHYLNGIIYKNIDTFQKLTLLYSYDDNNDYSNSNIKQNTFVYLLKQKIKFRDKHKNKNYVDYLKTNPLIFVDTLNKLLIIPGISFEFKVYNYDEKVNKYFVRKSDIKSNTLYNPCFIKLHNDRFKSIVKVNRKTDRNGKKNGKKYDKQPDKPHDKKSIRQSEQHIENYFAKKNSLSNTKKLKTNLVPKEENNSVNELNVHSQEYCNNEIKHKVDVFRINDNSEKKKNGEICDHMEQNDDKNFNNNNVDQKNLANKMERRKRKSLNTISIPKGNNNTNYNKKHKNNNVSNLINKMYNDISLPNGLKGKGEQMEVTTVDECKEEQQEKEQEEEEEEQLKQQQQLEQQEQDQEESYEHEEEEYESSCNNDRDSNKSTHFFYDLVNEYEIYINNVKCFIIFDLKSCYKNLNIMKKLKKNLEELKKPNNVFKEIINKKTFKSSRDKIEFIKRFKKMIIPNFRIEKIRKQRNHLIIIELMSKIQNSLIIKRLYQELTNKVNLDDLIKNTVQIFARSVEKIKNENIKKFYLSMINTYFQNKNLSVIDFKNLIQLFKKKEEKQKNEEFYNLFQNDLNYLEKNKKQCEEIDAKINSLKYLILESILKEKQLERSVNRLLLNHEQSKYGYFYKVDQSDDNTLDTTEYGKLLENFSKEPVNFYTILNKRNLDKHAYHDIRNFNYKRKNEDEALKHDATTSSHNQANKSIRNSCEGCKLKTQGDEENQRTDKNKKNECLNSVDNNENCENNSLCNANKPLENQCANKEETNKNGDNVEDTHDAVYQKYKNEKKTESHKCNNQEEYYKCKLKKIKDDDKNLAKKDDIIIMEKYKDQYDKKINCCKIIENKNTQNSVTTNNYLKKSTTSKEDNIKKIKRDTAKNYINKCAKESIYKKSNSSENRKQPNLKEKYKNDEEEIPSEYESEYERDIIRSTCEKKKFIFAKEKQEKINNEIFYKVFEQYPYSFFSKSVKNYNLILNENKEESELSWLTMLKKKNHNKSILPPSRDTFRDGTHFSNCRATEHTLKFFLSLLSLLTKGEIDINLKQYLKKNIQFLNTELFSMKLNLDKKRAILEKRLDHFNFQENSEFSFYNPLKMNIRMMNLIGRGGFAEVWEVFDSINLEIYAAKIHKIEPSMTNEIKNKIIQRAENEINIHIHCHRHIFIVKLEFFFVFGSATNLLVGMELCDIDLDKYIKYHGPINELLALCWIKQILLGLLYMKTLPTGKVHHCDLKPANLLIKDGIIKISDFGLAKLILPDTYQYYNGGGTLYYQPPECLKNKKNIPITDKIDIWSLGCILYEMLFCERPFQFNYLEKCSKELLVNKMKRGLTYPKINQQISEVTLNYIQYLLNFDYEFRPSIEEALSYPIFNFFRIP
ncbi:serine/threonine protein kinase [Plasmodium gonderi]|uniref:Serine/threonine protein kinase n=1 Tax=Plasmodium gonderi TaxID=77519 RepID=A0A1Y1JG65_PLAGO|nr:serine/threonine protein kinase [Plasmodium gonderi]GAW81240.1 serine/threonine protein kinase [Plasmodium gonderi]